MMSHHYNFVLCVDPQHKLSCLKQCLRNRLYVSGWSLNSWMHELIGGDQPLEEVEMSICIDNWTRTIVGICLRDLTDNSISTFVKQSYRRQGIGKGMVGLLSSQSTILPEEGIAGSMAFYEKALDRKIPV